MDNTQDKTLEEKWYEFWEKEGLFRADPGSAKPPYSLLMPPPNLTGDPHMGHAMQHAILDAIARFKRMQGFDVLLTPGVDHAGIQFESTFNKKLDKEGTSKYQLGREEWLKRAWQFRDEVYQSFHGGWTIFGISADWSREVFTLEPKVQKAVLHEFQTFWDQNLIYKGAYIVQWCPKDQTAIDNVEMEYEEREEKLYYINYKIAGTEDDYITIATARPETIAADVAIAIYPNHPKYAKFLDFEAINPFTNTKIPIIEDDRVEKDFGTGALKITPGSDILDYEIGQTHGLEILQSVGKDGKITILDPKLSGMKVAEARLKAAEILRELGQIEKEENYTHSVPVCERCKTTIEPLISEEWFVKMKPLSDKALKRIKEVNFVPKNYLKILSDWIKDVHDWCISRPLWWGHRIPVWYCNNCNPNKIASSSTQVSRGDGEEGSHRAPAATKGSEDARWETEPAGPGETYLNTTDKPGMVISLEKPDKCPVCGSSEFTQEEKVLDTWFSSGLWPMATLGWPEKTKEFQRYFPYSFELSAPEIKYLWIARMIMLALWFEDKIPFKDMFFHGTMRDLQGRKMSKSLGNGVDPKDLLIQWGTDATRLTLFSYSTPGRDPKASRQTMDERAKNYRNFGTKLKNIHRFIIELAPEDAKHLELNTHPDTTNEDDKKILASLDKTITKVTKNLESFQLHLAVDELYEFIWHQFADIYIEKSKSRRAEAQPTLEYVLKTSLELLHPFMPFLSEDLWQKLPHEEKSIMLTPWPKA